MTPPATLIDQAVFPHRVRLEGEEARYGGFLESLSECRWSRGNEASLLIDGEATFDAIFRAIKGAARFILVEFYIVKNDETGNRLRELLEAKAREGVSVHFLYDAIGCFCLPRAYLRSLRQAGVDARRWDSTAGPGKHYRVGFRNHRKIVVCDGTVGFIGGHNVGDEYVMRTARFGDWRDTHVALRGPSVLSLRTVFLEDYFRATRERLKIPPVGCPDAAGASKALVLPTGPEGGVKGIKGGAAFFLHSIAKARRRLWVATPFFVVDEPLRTALKAAVERGVDVRIMIPGAAPYMWIPSLVASSYLPEMEAAGVKVFRYEAGFLHQKVVLVDESFAAVGTANLDNRSMRLNLEAMAVILCESFAGEVEEMLLRDFGRCREMAGEDFADLPWWCRLAARLASLASPVL